MALVGRFLSCLAAVIVLLPAVATAQQAPPPQQGPPPLNPDQIDQLVAPIALHPDKLLAQILMASTYPLEVVQAARFVKENPKLQGDQLSQALQQQTWDDSVKSLCFFPQVLTMMNDKLDWLQKLGDAFLSQQQDVMAGIQQLRARAEANGQLKSTPEQKVIVEPAPPAPPTQTTVQGAPTQTTIIKIEQADPQVVYVPSYNPAVVYGAFPPAYPPYSPYPPGYFAAGVFTFAAGMAVGSALWGDCDWNSGGGDVTINNSTANNFTNRVNTGDAARNRVEHYNRGSGQAGGNRGQWQHQPEHRKGVQYRDTATQQRFNKGGPGNAQSREAFRGREQGGFGQQGGVGQQGGFGQQGGRGQQGGLGQQGGGFGDRGPQASPRDGGFGQSGGFQGRQGGGAFQGAGGGGGRDAQRFSDRGNSSRGAGGRSAGGGRSGGGGQSGGGGRSGGGGGRSGGGGGRR